MFAGIILLNAYEILEKMKFRRIISSRLNFSTINSKNYCFTVYYFGEILREAVMLYQGYGETTHF